MGTAVPQTSPPSPRGVVAPLLASAARLSQSRSSLASPSMGSSQPRGLQRRACASKHPPRPSTAVKVTAYSKFSRRVALTQGQGLWMVDQPNSIGGILHVLENSLEHIEADSGSTIAQIDTWFHSGGFDASSRCHPCECLASSLRLPPGLGAVDEDGGWCARRCGRECRATVSTSSMPSFRPVSRISLRVP